jgi:hypothetical protein
VALPEVQLPSWNGANFGHLTPIEVLVSYDGPITFTFRDAVGVMMLAHLVDEDASYGRYVVAPTSAKIIGRLKAGAISVRDAIDQPIVWLIDMVGGTDVVRSWAVSFTQIPASLLPAPDVMLSPRLQPMIRLRAIGSSIKDGAIPAATIRNLVTGAEQAYRKLRDQVRGTAGTVSTRVREFNVLDAQQFAFNSVEIAFRPTKQENAGDQEKVEELFAAGLRWVQQFSSAPPSESDDVNLAVLEAIKSLSPGRGSRATKIEVSGRVLERATGNSSDRIVLTRNTRKRATSQIRRMTEQRPSPEYLMAVGRIKEADTEKYTFQLRDRTDVPDAEDVVFAFQPDDIDDIADALRLGYEVRVGGTRDENMLVYQLVFVEPLSSSVDASDSGDLEADGDDLSTDD